MANMPVQVILKADNFRKDKEKTAINSAGMDFYEGNDEAFELHKQRLRASISSVSDQIGSHAGFIECGRVGYVKVIMRSTALAKSHRPINAIFRRHIAPTVGVAGLGEMIAKVDPGALVKIDEAIAKAEVQVKLKIDKKTGEEIPAPSKYRCEVGAIEKIELWGKSDRRRFDITEAVSWLSNPRTGHTYQIELFEVLPHEKEIIFLEKEKGKLFKSFYQGLHALGQDLVLRMPDEMAPDNLCVSVGLINYDGLQGRVRGIGDRKVGVFNSNLNDHKRLIGFLEGHPLVREIHLPHYIEQSDLFSNYRAREDNIPLPKPLGDFNYPKVGIIDSGISAEQASWVIYKHGLLANEHVQLDHGTFIGGLVVAARAMNPDLGFEPDGCMMADIDIFPDPDQENIFEEYYYNGLDGFFDELEMAVKICREEHGIRVFNLSLNIISPVLMDRYSLSARRLDKISDEHDVIFVVSAGNLDSGKMRPEWPNEDAKATAILATKHEDHLYVPAESIRNISVSAINPAGMSNSLEGALACYSRRGPGFRVGVKPDLCHIGGSGTECPSAENGLYSRAPDGSIISGCGTSYSAPLVAKTIACLDALIEGDVTKEALIGLAIHSAKIPAILDKKIYKGLSRQLVGFGCPSTAVESLEGSAHEITLMFSSRVLNGKVLEFKFAWPSSLVLPGGKCRGNVKLTLVSTPHLDYRFGEELVRVNIEAALQQETAEGKYKSQLEPTYVFFSEAEKVNEANLIEHKFKWAPIKSFAAHIPKGRGESSNWRLVVNHLTRAGEILPDEGVPFSVLLTISDPDKKEPVFQEMRQSLQAYGIQMADIRTAARIASHT